ncbi:IclR family transcriptional regulator [Amycolatopsis pithecellobii]|uniref:Helix-turn-helix domain-containing protein n=1 Tax=Amycolatopsis pithecellobii TaxID=664692 RepID=A0A6N7YSN2_9PSEU|nr:IclR family transcriptional regulator [Amycolatopsis pithecellobii]MTD54948.1 helix-turn-helix domain-containing protein [Amycolatopsis pithecellobii]
MSSVRTGVASESSSPLVVPAPVEARPAYAITSVDNALRLVQILTRDGSVRVSEAAAELGVAKSTAHRLLGMLCYRGFACKDGDRLYRGGPALGSMRRGDSRQDDLCAVARPFLERVQREFNETVHLMVLRRTNVEFLTSLECNRSLRVSSRVGALMSAYRTSGGQALLAALDDAELARRFRDGPPDAGLEWEEVRRVLAAVRRRGYGINDGSTERGVVAIGACVRGPDREPVAALCISAPSLRLQRRHFPQAAQVLHRHIALLEAELARTSLDRPGPKRPAE